MTIADSISGTFDHRHTEDRCASLAGSSRDVGNWALRTPPRSSSTSLCINVFLPGSGWVQLNFHSGNALFCCAVAFGFGYTSGVFTELLRNSWIKLQCTEKAGKEWKPCGRSQNAGPSSPFASRQLDARHLEYGKFSSLRHFLAPREMNKMDARSGVGIQVAPSVYMRRDLTFWLGILAAVLLLSSLGAFLLYVPILPLGIVVVTLLGLILMFLVGVEVGGRRIRISRMRKAPLPGLSQWNSQG